MGPIEVQIERLLNGPAEKYARTLKLKEPLNMAVIFATGFFDTEEIREHKSMRVKVQQLQRLVGANPLLHFTILAGNDKDDNDSRNKDGHRVLDELERQFHSTPHSENIQLRTVSLHDVLTARGVPQRALFEGNLNSAAESIKWGTIRLLIYIACTSKEEFDFCILTDSDPTLDVTQAMLLAKPMVEDETVGAVCGSRFKPGSIRNIYSYGSEMEIGHFYPLVYDTLGIPALAGMDVSSGAKALRVDDRLLKAVSDMETNNFQGDWELIMLLYLRGAELDEAPISVNIPSLTPEEITSTVPQNTQAYVDFLREVIGQRIRHAREYAAQRGLNVPDTITEADERALAQLAEVDLEEVKREVARLSEQFAAREGRLGVDLTAISAAAGRTGAATSVFKQFIDDDGMFCFLPNHFVATEEELLQPSRATLERYKRLAVATSDFVNALESHERNALFQRKVHAAGLDRHLSDMSGKAGGFSENGGRVVDMRDVTGTIDFRAPDRASRIPHFVYRISVSFSRRRPGQDLLCKTCH